MFKIASYAIYSVHNSMNSFGYDNIFDKSFGYVNYITLKASLIKNLHYVNIISKIILQLNIF